MGLNSSKKESNKAIIISYNDWYERRLRHVADYLSAQGYQVTIAISDFDHTTKEYISKRNNQCIYVHVKRYQRNISISRVVSYIEFSFKIFNYIKIYNPSLLYLVVPPNCLARQCANYLKHNPETKLIVDVIDLWPESFPSTVISDSLLGRMWKRLRDVGLETADYVFTECDYYHEILSYAISEKPTTTLHLFKDAYNEKDLGLLDSILEEHEKRPSINLGSEIVFAYLGSINHIIDMDSICSFLQILMEEGYQTRVRIIGGGESKEEFCKKLQDIGCKIEYFGMVFDDSEKIKRLAICDFAFNMMTKTSQVGLTMKSIEYLAMGLPIINNIRGDTWEVVDEERIGINIAHNNISSQEVLQLLSYRISHRSVLQVSQKRFSKKAFIENLTKGFNNI